MSPSQYAEADKVIAGDIISAYPGVLARLFNSGRKG